MADECGGEALSPVEIRDGSAVRDHIVQDVGSAFMIILEEMATSMDDRGAI